MASVLPYRPTTAGNDAAPTSTGLVNGTPSLRTGLSSKRSTSPPPPVASEAPPVPPKMSNVSSKGGLPSYAHSAAPSKQSSVARRRKQVRPQYPADSPEKHVEYILVASFDIDRGSVMEHQYPASVGGDEYMLAELMLPEQTHVRSQDWTMFFLHKDTSEEDQEQADKPKAKRKGRALDGSGNAAGVEGTVEDDEDGGDSDEEEEDLKSVEGPPLVYVLNLVNTKQDTTAKRGAVCKAMAICTRHSFLHIYKPLLLLALEEYFRTPVPATLASLYDAVNSMDLSLLPQLSHMERQILQGSDVKDLFVEKFEAMIQQRMAIANPDRSPQESIASQGSRPRYGLPRDTHEFESVVPYNSIPIPIKLPTAVQTETVGDFSLVQLIQTFSGPHSTSPQPFTTLHPHLTTSGSLTHPIIVLLNALLTQKRVIFMGHNLPSSNVAEAVLAASALASGGLLRGFIRHAFPYTDLTKIDDLLKVPGFIAGVTNPTFAMHEEWWDLLCDLPTGRMKISTKIEQAPLAEGVLFFQQPGQQTAALTSSGLDQKTISQISAASGSLSAGQSGVNASLAHGGDHTGDNAFMAGVLKAINDRHGEAAIRAKFRLWVLKFTRLAASLEELVYGASALHGHLQSVSPVTSIQDSPATSHSGFNKQRTGSQTTSGRDPAVVGYGYVWPSAADKVRELAANATRVEGWMKTRSYYNLIQDIAVLHSYRAIKDLDLQHLHDKLMKLRLGADASAAIYLAIGNHVRSYEEINQLLVVMVNSGTTSLTSGAQGWANGGGAAGGGGLLHIALGLFHPRTDVREAVAELLGRIRDHEAGRHFWAKLGGFERAAWERVMVARRNTEET